MQQKFTVGICTFSYGGNGGISSEVPDIREWMVPLVAELSRDQRVENVRIWNLADTPITMTRNRSVLMAREFGVDILVMVDSDMKPDINAGQIDAKPFFQSSFDFLVNHYPKGPCVIGAPYCGPPPMECVYVFRWQNMQSDNPNPDFQLEMFDRNTAISLAGIQECAALPTGLIMYDMRAFALTEPASDQAKPWFYYEWKDKFCAEKASTEDVTMTRDLSLVGADKLGYNPVFCNWDAWAGHWKPKCVGKPQVIAAKGVSEKLKASWAASYDPDVKLVSLRPSQLLQQKLLASPQAPAATYPPLVQRPNEFNALGMGLPEEDATAIRTLITDFFLDHGYYPTVAEIGSWAGRSALIMSQAGATVHCIDHWKGNHADAGTSAYAGKEPPYDVFKANVAGTGIMHTVGESPGVASTFPDKSFDIVYIDAEHTFASVMADIKAWAPKAKHLLAGHDYGVFPGVRLALNASGLLPVTVRGTVWSSARGA